MRRTRLLLLAVAVTTTVLGCSAVSTDTSGPVTQRTALTQASTASPSAPDIGPSDPGRSAERGRGGESRPQPVGALPTGLPLPPGVVTAVSSGPGRWSVLLVVSGTAQHAESSAIAFYVGHAFHRDSASLVHGRGYRISMIAENRDHSAAEADLTLVVNRQT